MPWRLSPITISVSSRNRTLLPVALVAGVAVTGLGLMLYQISKVLFNIVRECDYEARKLVQDVTVAITADYGDVVVPDDFDIVYEDEAGAIYSYGVLQVLYFRRLPEGAATDWEWSYDQIEWWPTSELSPDESAPLDPPNLIFLCRLHLASVARRKSSGRVTVEQHQRIPPALDFSRSTRDLSDAPDALCCPITGQIMLQPVCSPSGKTYEYATLVNWISRHGTDPNTHQPLSLLQLNPNLVVRELIEAWAAGAIDLSEVTAGTAGTAGRGVAAAAAGSSGQDGGATASSSSSGMGVGSKRPQQQEQGQRALGGTPTSSGADQPFVMGSAGEQEGMAAADGSTRRRSRQFRAKGDTHGSPGVPAAGSPAVPPAEPSAGKE